MADPEQRLANLHVAHILSRPDPGWRGGRGCIDGTLLRRHAPASMAAWSALVSGPPAMVTDTTCAVARLGMPPTAVQAEGFE